MLEALFSSEGCGFNYCRLPIGANDYAESWYSHNEAEGDPAMSAFSIERDHRYLIPFIEAARAVRGADFFLFASPWSPPSWMQAYAALGITVHAVHVRNEPNSDQKFPSCLWTGAKMRDFIRDDLGPAFARTGLRVRIPRHPAIHSTHIRPVVP